MERWGAETTKGGTIVKRPYETVVIFDGTLSDTELQKQQQSVESHIQKNADFEETDVWGKRRLAYEIKSKLSGYYCRFLYMAEGNFHPSLERLLRLNDTVLRHCTLKRKKREEEKYGLIEKIKAEDTWREDKNEYDGDNERRGRGR
jgi:small subunit ribosomal protein S6